MKVCYFGTYERNHPRNSVILNSLKIEEIHYPLWKGRENKINLTFLNKSLLIIKLPFIYAKLLSKIRKFDLFIVGYIGQLDILILRVFTKKNIIFNPMISLYDTFVNDRKIVKNRLLKRLLHFIDQKACDCADIILLDTPKHLEYFRKEFGIYKGYSNYLYIGADKIFKPMNKEKRFKVLFYGKYSPLHGNKKIIETAKLLPDIDFEIIGKGQTHNKDIKNISKNVKLIDWVDYKKLPEKISEASVCIGGHFGKSEKAKRVIPCKVFQMIAMKKPIIVNKYLGNSFKNMINCIISESNPKAIAEAILLLKNNKKLRDRIGNNAYKLYNKRFAAKKIVEKLNKEINMIKVQMSN